MTEKQVAEKEMPWERLKKGIESVAKLDRASGLAFEIAQGVVNNIATSENLDDLFDANEAAPLQLRDLDAGSTITVIGVSYLQSAEAYAEGGFGYFVVMTTDKIDPKTQQNVLYTTGAPNIVATIRRAQELGFCNDENPFTFRLMKSQTPNGVLLKAYRPQN